jgi:hypothetical protein
MHRKGSPAYQLLPELEIDPGKGDVLVEKDVYDAFLGVADHGAHLSMNMLDGDW